MVHDCNTRKGKPQRLQNVAIDGLRVLRHRRDGAPRPSGMVIVCLTFGTYYVLKVVQNIVCRYQDIVRVARRHSMSR